MNMLSGSGWKLGQILLLASIILLSTSASAGFDVDGAMKDMGQAASKLADGAEEEISESNISVPTKSELPDDIVETNVANISDGLMEEWSLGEQSIENIETEADRIELDDSTERQIMENVEVATRQLPSNRSERIEITVDTASEICDSKPTSQEVNNVLQSVNDGKLGAKRLENAADILKENYNMDLNPGKFQGAYQKMQTASKYAPVTGSYLNLVNKSCAVERGDNESIKEFYQASAYFGAEIVLIQAGVAYKVSSKSVRLMNSKAGMARIRGYCGNKCYKAVLSEAHWTVRNGITGMKNYLMYESEKLGHKISEKDAQKFIDKHSERFLDKTRKLGGWITGAAVSSSKNGFLAELLAFFGL